jgi:hypothetical protein
LLIILVFAGTMKTTNIEEARADLKRLVEGAAAGEAFQIS